LRAAPLLLAVELIVTFRAENPTVRFADTRARPMAARWLIEHGRPGRFVNDVHLGQRFHNAGLEWGIDGAGGYSSLPIWRYLHLLWIANHGAIYPHARIAGDLTAQGLWRFSSPLVDLLSVNWVLAPRDRPPDGAGFRRVVTGGDGVDLWQNRQALPRAFLVYRAAPVADEAAAAAAIAQPSFRPSDVVVVERPVDAARPNAPALPGAGVEVYEREADWLRVEVAAGAPAVLVLSEPWYPGYRATIDGRPAEPLRVDYALLGVALPPGHHRVELTFHNAPFARGAAISLVALAVTAALARRRRAA
jgi:hypothetical protein